MTTWDALFLILALASLGSLIPIVGMLFALHGRDTFRVVGETAVDVCSAVGEAVSTPFDRR